MHFQILVLLIKTACVCIRACACMYTYMCMCVCVWVYVHVYVCMRVCVSETALVLSNYIYVNKSVAIITSSHWFVYMNRRTTLNFASRTTFISSRILSR